MHNYPNPYINFCIPQACHEWAKCLFWYPLQGFWTLPGPLSSLWGTTWREVWWESAKSRSPNLSTTNKWIKCKSHFLISTSPVCLVDPGIWWNLIEALQCWFTCHVISQVPSPGLPQEESVPRVPHAKFLSCRMVGRKCSVVSEGLWR